MHALYEYACSSAHLLFRILGSLLSTHLIITDQEQPFGDLKPTDYNNELLMLANDIATRLLPAFENTATGIPFPRVNPLWKKMMSSYLAEKKNLHLFLSMLYDPACSFKFLPMVCKELWKMQFWMPIYFVGQTRSGCTWGLYQWDMYIRGWVSGDGVWCSFPPYWGPYLWILCKKSC